MSVILLPTNVRLPTRLDDERERYLRGEIVVEEFERRVEDLLASGEADQVAPHWGMQTVREWR